VEWCRFDSRFHRSLPRYPRLKARVSDVAEMVRSVRGYLVVPLKPSWEKGTQLGVQLMESWQVLEPVFEAGVRKS